MFAACVVAFAAVAAGIGLPPVRALDAAATSFLHGFASPRLDAVMESVTTMGDTLVLLLIALASAVALAVGRRWREVLFLTVAVAGSGELNTLLKHVFARPRPDFVWARVLSEYSLPSGHAENSVALFVGLAIVVWSIAGRRIGMAALVAAGLIAGAIGLSRVYLGVHYLTDVVAGALGGIAWLLAVGGAIGAAVSVRERPGDT